MFKTDQLNRAESRIWWIPATGIIAGNVCHHPTLILFTRSLRPTSEDIQYTGTKQSVDEHPSPWIMLSALATTAHTPYDNLQLDHSPSNRPNVIEIQSLASEQYRKCPQNRPNNIFHTTHERQIQTPCFHHLAVFLLDVCGRASCVELPSSIFKSTYATGTQSSLSCYMWPFFRNEILPLHGDTNDEPRWLLCLSGLPGLARYIQYENLFCLHWFSGGWL